MSSYKVWLPQAVALRHAFLSLGTVPMFELWVVLASFPRVKSEYFKRSVNTLQREKRPL